MKVKKYIILLLLFAITIASNAQTWVAIDSTYNVAQKPTIEVLVSDATQYKFRITIHGYYKNTILENNTQYEQIDITGWHTLNNVGEPALPTFTQFVGLPANNECSVTISETEWTTLPAGKIYPAQEPREESDTTELLFTINDSVYNVVEYQTDRYIVGDKACVSGMYGVPLSVLPIKYYPIQGEIDILKSCVVTVDFSSASIVDGNLSIKNAKLLKNVVDNYNEALVNTYNIPAADSINTNIYDYLIITADKYKNSDALKEFCTWKRIKGHNCKIVSCSEIGGNRPDSIKACVKQWYEKGVEYVLFVGNKNDITPYTYIMDINEIPALYSQTVKKYIPSDYWYACVDGGNNAIEQYPLPLPEYDDNDSYADLAIGRFPLIDTMDLETMISKTIAYENYTPNDAWVTKNLIIAHKQNAPEKYQKCCEEIRTTEYVKKPNFTTAYGASDSVSGNNATNDMLVSLINEGYGIVNYRGHGVITGWRDDWCYQELEFNYDYVKELLNDKYPIVLSVACETGYFVGDTLSRLEMSEYDDKKSLNFHNKSLMYIFLTSKYGAVSYIGATVETNTEINDSYNLYLYDLLYNNKEYTLGSLNVAAQINTFYKNSNSYVKDIMAYICGGDPSLEIWTDTISKFPDIDISYDNGVLSIDTRKIEDYTVTLFSQTDSNYFRKQNVEGTIVTLSNIPRSFVLSLNKHNYMPLVYNVTNGDVYIQNENYALVRNISANNVFIGSDVTSSKPQGGITVKSGAILNIEANGKTLINKNFKVEKDAKIIIK